MRACDSCGVTLTPEFREDTDYQFDNALWIGFHGGYGMFVDSHVGRNAPSHNIGGADEQAVICHDCAHALCEAHPWIAAILEPATSHAHDYDTDWTGHKGWDLPHTLHEDSLPGTVDCSSYRPGHNAHWLQASRAHQDDDAAYVTGTVQLADDHIAFTDHSGSILALHNHDVPRIVEALRLGGNPECRWYPDTQLLSVPSNIPTNRWIFHMTPEPCTPCLPATEQARHQGTQIQAVAAGQGGKP